MRILEAKYIKGASSVRQLDLRDDIPEVSFIGRSNVGKSSLINALATQRVARTSSRPGATRIINIYNVLYESRGKRGTMLFSDFPGFGYAKVSRAMAVSWQGMVEGYLAKNNRIKAIIWLLDVRRDFDELDEMLLEWLILKELPFSPILTKVDKENQGNISRKVRSFEQFFEGRKAILFSAKTGRGKKELLAYIDTAIY
ncbi:MAG: ribosome biogenesis GTP-binding protein YihA/YsxC [Syntrophorhabdaceae bacterium]|nr:ribosome biogenesis GTP-binding protein YihA/YsxC [Syntrophorhabdaceae bacterium]MDD4196413.1 ribosome biogenesis GTP-binding protein YihA/YsxC [Syntrophorhabdaceae bacterium]